MTTRPLTMMRTAMVAVALVGYALDRWTKQLALTHLATADGPSFLNGWVSLQLVLNPGAAFSMGSSVTIVFSVLSIAAVVAVIVWGWPRAHGWLTSLCAGMVACGIAGNLTDRLVRPPGPLRGHVVDFISVQHFAVFNVADVFITCSVVLFAIYLLRADHAGPGPDSGRPEPVAATDHRREDHQEGGSSS
nr:signal peptidase II [Propionibacterium freudenreichii]